MGMSEFYGPTDDTESIGVLTAAFEAGVNFFDTSDMYGPHHNEELLGRFRREVGGGIRIATKFGIVRNPGEYARSIDNSAEYTRLACDASLRRLGVDRIDLYYIHRIDRSRPVEEVMGALADFVAEGKIAHIGLCEVSAETLRRAHSVHPVTAIQTEYSLWTRDAENTILPVCRELGIGFVPYSPLGRGFLTGQIARRSDIPKGDFRRTLPRFESGNLSRNTAILKPLSELARSRGASVAQIALAWVMAKGNDIVPIPGTKRLAHLHDNLEAANLTLMPEDIDALDKLSQAHKALGDRYTAEGMKGVDA
ncbi:oxidoreductase [Sulfitobacter porphyrae]|nr:oxidoreductase [Sulfitobacter porphyrae]